MFALFRQFLALLVFRAGPADMPEGWRPVFIAGTWFLVVGLMLGMSSVTTQSDVPGALGQSLWDTGVDIGVLTGYSLLWARLRHHQRRVPQMLTALFGALGMLGVLFIPLMAWKPIDMTNPTKFGGWAWFVMGLFFWNLIVAGQIYRRTLVLSAGVGVVLALGYFVVSALVSLGLALGVPGVAG